MSWWVSTRQVLQEIFVNFLLPTPHVHVAGSVASLKAKVKQWRLIDFPAWFNFLSVYLTMKGKTVVAGNNGQNGE